MSRYFTDSIDNLADGKAVPVAAIEHEPRSASFEIIKAIQMRGDEIGDMDIVANAGSVVCRKITATDVQDGDTADGRLAGPLDQLTGVWIGLAGAAERIGSRDVEIAQCQRA